MIARVAIPSRGRLRDFALELLNQAGFTTSLFDGHGSRAIVNELEFIEMRPRDAAAWLSTGRINGAFISTDLVLEEDLGHLAALPLGSAQSDLVIASREGDGRTSVADLTGAIVATHLPKTAPTVLPLAAREDIVAVHIVVEAKEFWNRLHDLRTLGATDIVALPPNAILR